jgi:hypothetical protein
MIKNVAIVHYNTPELTGAGIRSLWKQTPDAVVTVFDNSDKRPFLPMDGVTILDNTTSYLIDFQVMLDCHPNKIPTACNWGSEKHIASVEYLFDVFPEGFVLMDSDVLVKRDISPFFDPSVAWMGGIEREPKFWFQAVRCLPFLLWINVPMCKRRGIRFYHEGYVYKMSHRWAPFYDTGGSFYKDCNDANLPFREVDITGYIEHLGGASCYPTKWQEWLEQHKSLYL